MNPLSPVTYYRRHKRSALVQAALIVLATVGLYVLVAVLEALPLRANVDYLTVVSRVIPVGETLDPGVVSQIQTHPDVAHTVPDNGLPISPPTLMGRDSRRLLGVSPQDAEVLMAHCGVRLKEGRLFEPRSNEVVLSEEIARALDLQVGSEISRAIDKDYYAALAAPLVVVGILEGDPAHDSGPSPRLGFVSAEYLSSHELYAPRATSLLVLAREGRKASVDHFLETAIRSPHTEVETYATIARFARAGRMGIYAIFGVVNSVVAVVVAFVVGTINQIAVTKRLSEFGLLHALGHHRKRLVRRLALETTGVAATGCLVGLAFALLAMWGLQAGPFYALGMELALFSLAPFLFVLPIPLAVIGMAFLSARRIFAQLDAVAIVERGKLSMETSNGGRGVRRSSGKPLSSLTFYLRHRRRGVLLTLSTALMVLGVALPVFLLSAVTSAMTPGSEHLAYLSEVGPAAQSELAPQVVSQIKSHPAVARVIPAIRIGIQMVVPPGSETPARVYGVSEADLPVLLDLFGLQVQEGRLPRTRSNEVVLSAAVAANRDLRVGDTVGGQNRDGDGFVVDDLPVEMVLVGILSPDRPWVGFASYEYLAGHELTSSRSPRLLTVAHAGQKETLDRWLEGSVASTGARVATYGMARREYREAMTSLTLTFALLQLMIAAVAAAALATLNHIFFAQRQEEYGILNAIGRGRRWLVLRTVGETGSVAALAWLAGAALCGLGLVLTQVLLYAPRGLTLDYLGPAPWLFTLPIPVTVVVASAGTVAWMLSRLDPVAVVEQR